MGLIHVFYLAGNVTITQQPTQQPTPQCPNSFTSTSDGCFYFELTQEKNWNDAEAECQAFGSHVHLITLDSLQVILLYIAHCLLLFARQLCDHRRAFEPSQSLSTIIIIKLVVIETTGV